MSIDFVMRVEISLGVSWYRLVQDARKGARFKQVLVNTNQDFARHIARQM